MIEHLLQKSFKTGYGADKRLWLFFWFMMSMSEADQMQLIAFYIVVIFFSATTFCQAFWHFVENIDFRRLSNAFKLHKLLIGTTILISKPEVHEPLCDKAAGKGWGGWHFRLVEFVRNGGVNRFKHCMDPSALCLWL